MNNSITIHNKKVIEFYKNNPSLDFEQINVLCVDLFENVLQDANNHVTKAVTSQILLECKENKERINDLNNSISKLNNELILRSIDVKKEYIEEVKNIIGYNMNEKNEKIKDIIEKLNEQTLDKTKLLLNDFNTISCNDIETNSNRVVDKTIIALNEYNSSSLDKISSLFEKNANHLVEKTKYILNDIIPESKANHEKYSTQIQDNINKFYTLLNEDTKKMVNNSTELDKSINNILIKYQERFTTEDKKTSEIAEKQNVILNDIHLLLNKNKEDQLSHFIQNFDTKYQMLLQGIQNPIVSVINSSEERLNSSISVLNETTNKQQVVQTKVLTDLEEFLNKYRNSSFKGQLSENHLSSVLTKMFPTAEITDTSKMNSACDFSLKRENRDVILIENKDYNVNVDLKEIKKFINDCDVRKSHGIFLSQNTGITSKNNYQIEILNGNILVYVHHCEYMSSKIQIAVDIIDTLSIKIKELNIINTENDTDISISKEVMDEINDEYQKTIAQKETIINYVKDFQKNLIIQLEEIRFPKLEHILPSKYFSSSQKILRCEWCALFTADTVKKLSSHKRWCSKKPTQNNTPINDEPIVLEQVLLVEDEPKVIKNKKQKRNT